MKCLLIMVVVFLIGSVCWLFWWPETQYQDFNLIESDVSSHQNILNDLKKLDSNVMVYGKESEPEVSYAIYLIEDEYLHHYPFDKKGGGVVTFQDLVIINLDTGEQKIFNIFDQLTNPDLVTFINNIPPEITYNLRASLLEVAGNSLWGKTEVFSTGDPVVNSRVGYFAINLDTDAIENYALPDRGFVASAKLNVNRSKVLYESLVNGLTLYEYDLRTRKDEVVVHYSQATFDKHCSHFIAYVYDQTDFYGDCGVVHDLNPMWTTRGGVSYLDFVTRERIISQSIVE